VPSFFTEKRIPIRSFVDGVDVATNEFVVVPVIIPVAIIVGTKSGRPYGFVETVVVPIRYVPVCSPPGVPGFETAPVEPVLVAISPGVVVVLTPPGTVGGIITMPFPSSEGKKTELTETIAEATPETAVGTKRARYTAASIPRPRMAIKPMPARALITDWRTNVSFI
jgi:hypothetical protein